MGIAKDPNPGKLFLAITFAKNADMTDLWKKLEKKWKSPDFSYGPIPFDFTNYYQKEMGKNLQKIYVTFKDLIHQKDLSKIKTFSNNLEQKFLNSGKRTINLDPGFVSRDKLVLASTKDFFHRIYLDKGIYGEVTLHHRKGKYRYFSWTYPDYREPFFLTFLMKVRARCVKQQKDFVSEQQ